jgi:putative transposase
MSKVELDRQSLRHSATSSKFKSSENFFFGDDGSQRPSELVYHMALRGYKGHKLFRRDEDYRKFLYLLNRCTILYNCKIYGYVLMTNHLHILLKTNYAARIAGYLIRCYNGYYVLTRHICDNCRTLFDPPGFSIKYTKEFQLDTLMYILNNPVVAKMSKSQGGYPYSSYSNYTNHRNKSARLVNIDCSLLHENYTTFEEFRKDLKVDLIKRLSMKKHKKVQGLNYDEWHKTN